ncbi:putative spore coat assembly protein [Morganella phage vB_MmoM_Rgz1]|nr:putative spore coat assembly protein [Morganella phage vB_MmoM_Rgz1]
MKILLSDIILNTTIMVDSNFIISAMTTDSGTAIRYHTGNLDEIALTVVAEPIHYITNACNHEFHVYYVKPGDTLSEIARVLGVSLEHLLECNPKIDNPDIIYPMQVLKY